MDIDERLANWSRCMKDGRCNLVRGTLAMLYKAPYRQWMPLHEIELKVNPDVLDAALVEFAWQHMIGHRKELLRQVMMKNIRSGKEWFRMLRLVGVKQHLANAEIHAAKRQIAKILDEFNDYGITPQNLDRFKRESMPLARGFVRPKETAEDFY